MLGDEKKSLLAGPSRQLVLVTHATHTRTHARTHARSKSNLHSIVTNVRADNTIFCALMHACTTVDVQHVQIYVCMHAWGGTTLVSMNPTLVVTKHWPCEDTACMQYACMHVYVRAHKYLRVAANMTPMSCRFASLPHALEH